MSSHHFVNVAEQKYMARLKVCNTTCDIARAVKEGLPEDLMTKEDTLLNRCEQEGDGKYSRQWQAQKPEVVLGIEKNHQVERT